MKLLLPVDGSEHSNRVVEHAIRLTQSGGRYALVLLNVQTAIDAPEVRGHMPAREIEAMQEARGGDAMASARALLDAAAVDYEPVVALGPIAENIARLARERNCEAIIMGTHGAGTLRNALMGSVTAEVIRLAECPVTVVK